MIAAVILAALCAVLGLRLYALEKDIRSCARQLREDEGARVRMAAPNRAAEDLLSAVNRLLELREADEAEHRRQEHAIRQQISNISHDLRTPLTAVCGYLELLEREDKSEAVERYLACIGERAEAMRRLTEELFCYSVVLSPETAPELVRGDLRAALESSLAGAFPALSERGISPVVELPEEPVFCLMSEPAVSRVFGNLLSNAIKYSGGDLRVSLGDNAVVLFENSAPGLDEVQVRKLFDRFYTVEAARSSTGLGLAIAKTLMEQMRGSISAELTDGVLRLRVSFERLT